MNVTISLPDDLVKKARHLAVDQGVSLSTYLRRLLEKQVEESDSERARREARESQRAMMAKGFHLGIGKRTWTRDDLHDRDALRTKYLEELHGG